MSPSDSYDALTDPYSLSRLQAWALSAVSDTVSGVDQARALRTPHDPASFVLVAGSVVPQTDGFVAAEGKASFVHPAGAGPITVAAVALVGEVPSPYLLGVVALPEPVISPAPGWVLPITLSPIVSAPEV